MVRVRRFGVIRTSNVAAALYFVLILIFVIPFALIVAVMPPMPVTDRFGQPIPGAGTVEVGAFALLLLVVPFVYALIGWVFTAIFCLLYNLVARFTGGIEVETVRVTPPTARPELAGWGQPPAQQPPSTA